MNENNAQIVHKQQIDFLKKHENEMVNYIKKQDRKISAVKFEWSGVAAETVGNGLPQGGAKVLTLRIHLIDIKNKEINAFGFAVEPDNTEKPKKIVDMYTINEDYNYYEQEE